MNIYNRIRDYFPLLSDDLFKILMNGRNFSTDQFRVCKRCGEIEFLHPPRYDSVDGSMGPHSVRKLEKCYKIGFPDNIIMKHISRNEMDKIEEEMKDSIKSLQNLGILGYEIIAEVLHTKKLNRSLDLEFKDKVVKYVIGSSFDEVILMMLKSCEVHMQHIDKVLGCNLKWELYKSNNDSCFFFSTETEGKYTEEMGNPCDEREIYDCGIYQVNTYYEDDTYNILVYCDYLQTRSTSILNKIKSNGYLIK